MTERIVREQEQRWERYGRVTFDQEEALLYDIGAEMDKLVPGMASDLQWAMRDQTRLGITAGEQQLRTGLGVQFGGLNKDSTQEMVQRLTEGRPISSLMLGANEEFKKQLTAILLKRQVLGQNPRQAGSELRRVLGQQQGGTLARWLTVARTEMLDANRRGLGALYQRHSNVLRGKERMCTLDERTCMACIALDGMVYPLDAPEDEHQSGRCSWLPVLRHRLDEDRRGRRQKGQDWFSKRDASVQRRMMGPKLFEAWKDGRIDFKDLVMRRDNPGWRSAYYHASLRRALEQARTRSTLERLERTGQKLLRGVKGVKGLEAAGGAALWVLNPFGWRFAITKAMKLGTTILRSTAPDFLEAAHISESVRYVYHYLRARGQTRAFDATSVWIRTQEAEELADQLREVAQGRAQAAFMGTEGPITLYTREQFEALRAALGEQLRHVDAEDVVRQAIEVIRTEALVRYGPQSLPVAEVAATLPALPMAALREAALRQARMVVEQMLRSAPGSALSILRSQFDIREDIRTVTDLIEAVADFSLRRQTLALPAAFDDWDYWGEMAPSLRAAAQVTPGQGYLTLNEDGNWEINNELVRATYEGKFEAVTRPDPPSGGVFISVVDQIAGGQSRISVSGRTLWAEEGPSAEWVRNHTVNEIRQALRGDGGLPDPEVHYRPAFRGGPTAKYFDVTDPTTGEVVRIVEVVSGHWTRSIGRTAAGFEVKHETLFITPEDFQGLGFAEQFNDQAFAHYITHLVVTVGISTTAVGSYTWAKTRGFQWSGENWATRIIDSKEAEIRRAILQGHFTEDDLQRWLQQVVANQERGGMFSWELATLGQEKTWEITDTGGIRRRMHFGKMVMLNSGWSGYIRLIPPTAGTRWGFPYPRPPQLFPKYPMQQFPGRQALEWNPEPFIRAALLDAVRRSGEMDVPSILHGMLTIENELREGELLDRVNGLVAEVYEGLNIDPGSLRLMDVIEEVVSFHFPEAEWLADYLREVAYGVPEGLLFGAPRISPQDRQRQLQDRTDAADRAVRSASIIRSEWRRLIPDVTSGSLDHMTENAVGLVELYVMGGSSLARAIVNALDAVNQNPELVLPTEDEIQAQLAPQASGVVQSSMPTQTVWSYPTLAQFSVYTEEDAMAIYAHVYRLSDDGSDFEGMDDQEVDEFLRDLFQRYVTNQIPELPVEVSTALRVAAEHANRVADEDVVEVESWAEGVEREYRQGQSFASALSGYEAEPWVLDWDILSPFIDQEPVIRAFTDFLGAARPEPPAPTPIQVSPSPQFEREITINIYARIWEGEAIHFLVYGRAEPIATIYVVQDNLEPGLTRSDFDRAIDVVHQNIEALDGWGSLRDFPLYVVEPISGVLYRWNGSQTVNVFANGEETDVWTTDEENPTSQDMLYNIVIDHNLVNVVLPRLAYNIAATLRNALEQAVQTMMESAAQTIITMLEEIDTPIDIVSEIGHQYEMEAVEIMRQHGEAVIDAHTVDEIVTALGASDEGLVEYVFTVLAEQHQVFLESMGIANLIEAAGFTESNVRHLMESEGAVQYLPVSVAPPAPAPNPALNLPPDRGSISSEGLTYADVAGTIRDALHRSLSREGPIVTAHMIDPLIESLLFGMEGIARPVSDFDALIGRLEQEIFIRALAALQERNLDVPRIARNVAFEVWASVLQVLEHHRVRAELYQQVFYGLSASDVSDDVQELRRLANAVLDNVLLPGVERTATELLDLLRGPLEVIRNQITQAILDEGGDTLDERGYYRILDRVLPTLQDIASQMAALAPGTSPVEPPTPQPGQTIMIPRFGQIFTVGQRYRVIRQTAFEFEGILTRWDDQGNLWFDTDQMGMMRVPISELGAAPAPIGVGPTVVVSSTPTRLSTMDDVMANLEPMIIDAFDQVQSTLESADEDEAELLEIFAQIDQNVFIERVRSYLTPDDVNSAEAWFDVWGEWITSLEGAIGGALRDTMPDEIGFDFIHEDLTSVMEAAVPFNTELATIIDRYRNRPRPGQPAVQLPVEGSWVETEGWVRGALEEVTRAFLEETQAADFVAEDFEEDVLTWPVGSLAPNLLPADTGDDSAWASVWESWESLAQDAILNLAESLGFEDEWEPDPWPTLRRLILNHPILRQLVDLFGGGAPIPPMPPPPSPQIQRPQDRASHIRELVADFPEEWQMEANSVAFSAYEISDEDIHSIVEDYVRARSNGVPVQTAGADAFSRIIQLRGGDLSSPAYQRQLIEFIQGLQQQIVGGQRFGPRSIARSQEEVQRELERLSQVEPQPELDDRSGKIAKLRSAIKDNLASGRPPYRQDLEELANLTGKDPYTLLRSVLAEFEQPVDAATLRSFLERQRAAGGSLPMDDPYVRWLAQLEGTSQPEIIREVADAVPEQQDRPDLTPRQVPDRLAPMTLAEQQAIVDINRDRLMDWLETNAADLEEAGEDERAEAFQRVIDDFMANVSPHDDDLGTVWEWINELERSGEPLIDWVGETLAAVEIVFGGEEPPPTGVGAAPQPTPPPLPPAGQQLDNERMASALEEAIRRELPAWGLSPGEINDSVEAALEFFGSELDDPEAYAGISDLLDQAASWIDSIVPLAGVARTAATDNIVARWLRALRETGTLARLNIPDTLMGIQQPMIVTPSIGVEEPEQPWTTEVFDQNDESIVDALTIKRVMENLGWAPRFHPPEESGDDVLMDLPVTAQRLIFEHMQASNETTGYIHVDFVDPETGITIQVAVPMDDLELEQELGVLAGNGRYINAQEPYPPREGEWIYLDALAEGEEVAPVGQGDIGRVTGFDPDTGFTTVDWLNDAAYSLKWQQDTFRRVGFRQRMIRGETDWEIVENASAGIDPEWIVHTEIKRDDHLVWIWYSLEQ